MNSRLPPHVEAMIEQRRKSEHSAPVDVLAVMDGEIARYETSAEIDCLTGSDSAAADLRRRVALLRQARAAVAELVDDRAAMAGWIVTRGQDLRDHACADCVGNGDLVVKGWRCAYHTAVALVSGAA